MAERRWQQRGWQWGIVGLLGGGAIAALSSPIGAQVVADPSLGTTVTVNGSTFEITNGITVGGRNLFHSFSRFDVPNNGIASFLNAPTIVNILARVTEGSSSEIFGTIRAQGSANLFLMNPQGIFFGPNAQLNLGGSFVATSANAIQFPGGAVFSQTSTVEPQNPLLSVDPSALLFNQLNPGRIENRSTAGLITPDRSLLLVGGEVQLNGGLLSAPGGRVEVAGLAEPGAISLTTTGNLLSLSVPEGARRSNILLTNSAFIVSSASNIVVTAESLLVSGGSQLGTYTVDSRDAGDVIINARNLVSLGESSAVFSIVEEGASGDGGDIYILTGSLEVTNGSQLLASTFGQGNAGSVVIEARDQVSFSGTSANGLLPSAAFSIVEEGAVADGGDIRISTGSLNVTNGAGLIASTLGQGHAGDILIEARDQVFFSGTSANGRSLSAAYNTVGTEAVGNGGDIRISTGSLEVTNGAGLIARTGGQGNAGNVVIEARDNVIFTADSGALSVVQPGAVGIGGTISISTGSLEVSNGAQLFANTYGEGNAGNIVIDARDQVIFTANSAAFSSVEAGAVGNGGTISISTGSLEVSNGAGLVAVTRGGQGSAGDILIEARDNVIFTSSGLASSAVETGAIGDGGDIYISTGSLEVSSGAQLAVATIGQGNAGDILIEARDRVSFNGTNVLDEQFPSAAFSSVEAGAIGNGGTISIFTDSLEVTNGAQLVAGTQGQGDAGNIVIDARDYVIFNGTSPSGQSTSAAFSTVDTGAVGDGGDIRISTGSLEVTNGAQLVASTRGQGNAGNIVIDARDRVSFSGSRPSGQSTSAAFSTVEVGAVGNGGDIRISTGSLEVTNGTGLITSTLGQGNAGNIVIDARDQVTIYGTDLSGQLVSGVFASSESSGRAGDIIITASTIQLDNQGTLSTSSAAVDGGNITLNVQDLLLLRGGSSISATAGQAQDEGNGGNITINAPTGFIVADENSDITANAFTGRGGNVQITAQGIFGIQFRPQLTPLSDITASSQFGLSGVVTLNTPDVNPSQGLVALPTDFVDATSLIAQQCNNRNASEVTNSFYITGRGGIPYRPGDLPPSHFSTGDVRPVVADKLQHHSPIPLLSNTQPPDSQQLTSQITQAQGWVIDQYGTVILVAQAPTAPWLHPPECPSVSSSRGNR